MTLNAENAIEARKRKEQNAVLKEEFQQNVARLKSPKKVILQTPKFSIGIGPSFVWTPFSFDTEEFDNLFKGEDEEEKEDGDLRSR